MAACCTDGDYRHHGNLKAKKISESLKNTLDTIDINPERVNLVQISSGDKASFQAEIDAFVDHLHQLGPIR
jgi:coenzyme F420-reducing hydrogenase delta subunit